MSWNFDRFTAALNALHTATNALHADYAGKLAAAGHAVTADDHADTLVAAAQPHFAQPGQPPTYADHANAQFAIGMTHALLQFGGQFLPAKFQPVAAELAMALQGEPTQGELLAAAESIAVDAVAAAVPGAAPVLAVAGAVLQVVEDGAAASAAADAASTIDKMGDEPAAEGDGSGEASPNSDGGPGIPPEPAGE